MTALELSNYLKDVAPVELIEFSKGKSLNEVWASLLNLEWAFWFIKNSRNQNDFIHTVLKNLSVSPQIKLNGTDVSIMTLLGGQLLQKLPAQNVLNKTLKGEFPSNILDEWNVLDILAIKVEEYKKVQTKNSYTDLPKSKIKHQQQVREFESTIKINRLAIKLGLEYFAEKRGYRMLPLLEQIFKEMNMYSDRVERLMHFTLRAMTLDLR